MILNFIRSLFRDEAAQDVVEYSLLLAFVCLVSAALFMTTGGSVLGIWTTANAVLSNANKSAS